jgi:hypothetical protein
VGLYQVTLCDTESGERTMLARRFFATLDLLAALLVALGVFAGLPDRWWPIDAGAVLIIIASGASGVGLWLSAPWGEKVARVGSMVSLGLGLLLVAAISVSVSYLAGIYGPVGKGGAILLVLVAAMAVPYLIVFPAAQLVWLKRAAK